MSHGTPPFVPHISNKVASNMGVVGTLGTSDTGGTARVLPVAIDDSTGAQYVRDLNSNGGATGFEGGTVSIGTAASELTFTNTTKSIFIQADHANGTMVYIGPSTVTQAGADAVARLNAGDAMAIDIDDASAAIYAVGGTTGQKVYKMAIS